MKKHIIKEISENMNKKMVSIKWFPFFALLILTLALIVCGCGNSVSGVSTSGEQVNSKEADKENSQPSTADEKEEIAMNTEGEESGKNAEGETSGTEADNANLGNNAEEDKTVKIPASPSVAAWVAYWDLDYSEEDLKNLENLDTICHFASYYDVDKEVFIPEATMQFYEKTKNDPALADKETYLTVVNDLLLEKGSSLKDTDLLYYLLEDEDSRKAHAKKLLELAKNNGFDGLEIDYEAIKKDMKLWEYFIAFEKELYTMSREMDLKLRILLEPNVPIENISFIEGPEYVMMCYNLYGYGTAPGPKADYDFLVKMADKMSKLPGVVNFALANGGFDFNKDGSVTQITTRQAKELFNSYVTDGSSLIRDEASGALYFKAVEDDGNEHEIWYADEETIAAWQQWLRECGYDRFTIWRL